MSGGGGTPTDRMQFVLKFPGECCVEVSRDGEAQPCDKPAVAVAIGDAESDNYWPVCAYHSQGRAMLFLPDIIALLRKADR